MRKFWKLFVVVCDLEIQGRLDFKVWLWGKKMPKIVCFQPKLWNFRLCFSNSGTLPFQLWIMLARQHSVVFTVRNSRANKKYCACKNFSTCWKRPEKTRSHLNYCTAVRWYLLGWLDLTWFSWLQWCSKVFLEQSTSMGHETMKRFRFAFNANKKEWKKRKFWPETRR